MVLFYAVRVVLDMRVIAVRHTYATAPPVRTVVRVAANLTAPTPVPAREATAGLTVTPTPVTLTGVYITVAASERRRERSRVTAHQVLITSTEYFIKIYYYKGNAY